MKIKIRCDGCGRQIAVDEAFIGGVCRCPYCKALVAVEGTVSTERDGGRPDAPAREGAARPAEPAHAGSQTRRPAVPAQGQDELAAKAARQTSVPMASPAKVSGVVGIVLAVVLVGILAVGGVIAVRMGLFTRDEKPKSSPSPQGATPSKGDGPSAATKNAPAPSAVGPNVLGDMPITSPVVYCVEIGGVSPARRGELATVLAESVRSLGPEGKFNIVACMEGRVEVFGRLFFGGGPAGALEARKFLAGLPAGGPAPMDDGVRTAIESRGATVVLLGSSSLDAEAAGARAAAMKVKVAAVGLHADASAGAAYKALAGETGGACRLPGDAELKNFLDRAGHSSVPATKP